jgi:hypothetical protein
MSTPYDNSLKSLNLIIKKNKSSYKVISPERKSSIFPSCLNMIDNNSDNLLVAKEEVEEEEVMDGSTIMSSPCETLLLSTTASCDYNRR